MNHNAYLYMVVLPNDVDKYCALETGRFAPVDYCLTDNAPELENIACICCQQVAYIADDLSWVRLGI